MPKTIMHLDMDSYFASVEQQANPTLRGKPIGVTGKPIESTIIVTASREGKRFGLKAGMPVWEARKLCPNLILVPGDGARYLELTQRFIAILQRVTPMIEVSSIDEVYMDVTRVVSRSHNATKLAKGIQREFRKKLGTYITATIGIAESKTFAKLIAKRFKPDGVGRLDRSEMPEVLANTPVAEICGIGARIERRLAIFGIRTLKELGEYPLAGLKREFGVYGVFLKSIGLGQDPTPVIPYTEVPPPKSIGHSRTLPPDFRPRPIAMIVLRGLCDLVAGRLRKHGYFCRTVHFGFSLEVMRGHFGKQWTLPQATNDGSTIYEACLKILDMIPQEAEAFARVGVSASNLVDAKGVPLPLFGDEQTRRRLNQAMDGIREQYGNHVIQVASAALPRRLPEHVGGFAETGAFEFE